MTTGLPLPLFTSEGTTLTDFPHYEQNPEEQSGYVSEPEHHVENGVPLDPTDDTDPEGEVSGRQPRGKRNNTRALVRRVAAKYEELATASPEHLELLSTALGITNNTIDLTAAVISGSRSGIAPLTDVLALSEPADPYDLIVAAMSLGRNRIKCVWGILAQFGLVTGAAPSSDPKAGVAIAKAIGSIGADVIDEITAVVALAKK